MIQTAIRDHATATPPAEPKSFGFSSFAAAPSNMGAIEVGTRFAQGTTPLVVVIGAPGWGKSHLLDSVRSYMDRRARPLNVLLSAAQYTSNPERCDDSVPLLVDDAQDVWGNMKSRQQFRRLIERRVRTKRPTFICFADSVSRLEASRFVPCTQDWAFQSIGTPSKKERDYIVRQIADTERVTLSRPIVTLFARHLCGDGRSIRGAVRTLKVVRADWSRRGDVFEACGVLNPYLEGENGWDPRDVVWEIVNAKTQGSRTYDHFAESVCCYILVSLIGMSEFDVATFLGVSPKAAYSMSVAVKEGLTSDQTARLVETCKDAFVRSLDVESC